MKFIDFSSKHDVLIQNEDGSLTPMDVPYFQAKLVMPGTWQILSDGDFSYLVEGDEEALAIDSGYGCGNIRDFCQTLTDKPIKGIANTHDHFDHTANNCYFECAYMSEETRKKATIPFPSFEGICFPRDYPIKVIGEGYKFQLGNRELETFEIPDHATGSLAFLDKRERILFVGDEIMSMGKNLNGSVAQFERQLSRLVARRSEFDMLLGGVGVMEASLLDRYLANTRHILEGNEGEAALSLQAPPAQILEDSSGRVIYKRQFPRPCDLPKHMGEGKEYKRIMTYADCKIIYDIRRIKD